MLKLKLQYFGHLMGRTDSFENTLMLGKIWRREEKRMRWLDGITDSMDMLPSLLSHFSRVWLCATPKTAAHQAPPVPGILQARTLEWVAIFLSNAWKWKMKVKSLSHVRLFATPWTVAYQAPPSMGFPGRSTGVGCHFLLHNGHEFG